MEEILKKSTMCFLNETEYNSFKESCLPHSNYFIGWEILNEENLIHFKSDIETEFEFKVTFTMRKMTNVDIKSCIGDLLIGTHKWKKAINTNLNSIATEITNNRTPEELNIFSEMLFGYIKELKIFLESE